MKLTISEAKLNQDTYDPYIEITYEAKICPDPEIFLQLHYYKENFINLMVEDYRMALEKQLPDELKKYGIIEGVKRKED